MAQFGQNTGPGITLPGGTGKEGAGGALIGGGYNSAPIEMSELGDQGEGSGGGGGAIADMESAETTPTKTSADFSQVDGGFTELTGNGGKVTEGSKTVIDQGRQNAGYEYEEDYGGGNGFSADDGDYQTPSYETEIPDDMMPPSNPILTARGIDILRPYILLSLKYLPIIQNDNNVSNTSNLKLVLGDDNVVKVNQVIRLMELHRSVNKVIKITAGKIINESVIDNPASIISTFNNSAIASLNLVEQYNTLYSTNKLQSEFANNVPSIITAADMIIAIDLAIKTFEINYKVYRVIDESLDKSLPEFYNTVLENTILLFRSNVFETGEELSEEGFKNKLIYTLVQNNEDFRTSIQFKKIVEIAIIKDLLQKFKSFINGIFNLQDLYRDAIDFNIMSNEYNPETTLSQPVANKITNVIENISNISGYSSGNLTIDMSNRLMVDEEVLQESLESINNATAEETAEMLLNASSLGS